MGERLSRVVEALAGSGDPRLGDDYWRVVSADAGRGATVLVGVVHDHPASSHRVASVVRAVDPDAVALELPALAVPYFEPADGDGDADAAVGTGAPRERGGVVPDGGTTVDALDASDGGAADDAGSPASDGGEMRAAVGAAREVAADVVAVDTFDWRYFLRFWRRARGGDASPSTVRRALGNVAAVATTAWGVRFGRATGRPDGDAADYGVDATDDPATQAENERSHVARGRSLLGAFERPPGDVLFDETREANMAANIDALRETGTVVAVVGMAHLDAVADHLGRDE